MPERADVYVKNALEKGDLKVSLKHGNGTPVHGNYIVKGNRERVYLGDAEVSMIIDLPGLPGTKEYLFKVLSGVDITMSFSRSKSRWTMKIDPNDLENETPTSVNVEVGEDEPEYPVTDDDD